MHVARIRIGPVAVSGLELSLGPCGVFGKTGLRSQSSLVFIGGVQTSWVFVPDWPSDVSANKSFSENALVSWIIYRRKDAGTRSQFVLHEWCRNIVYTMSKETASFLPVFAQNTLMVLLFVQMKHKIIASMKCLRIRCRGRP